MINSTTVFLAFLGFMAFGYLSLIRLLAKQHLEYRAGCFPAMIKGSFGRQLVTNLGSSAFFISLPATALLLFWGWAPALIWLVVFHFFVESARLEKSVDGTTQKHKFLAGFGQTFDCIHGKKNC